MRLLFPPLSIMMFLGIITARNMPYPDFNGLCILDKINKDRSHFRHKNMLERVKVNLKM